MYAIKIVILEPLSSQLKPIRDAVEHLHISLDVVELGDFRGGVAKEVGYMTRGKRLDVAVFVFYSVD